MNLSEDDPISIIVEGAKKAGLPHDLPDAILEEFGINPDPTPDPTPDPYSTMTVDDINLKKLF